VKPTSETGQVMMADIGDDDDDDLSFQEPILSGASVTPTSQIRASAMLVLLIAGN
jgi:hypothetical protein